MKLINKDDLYRLAGKSIFLRESMGGYHITDGTYTTGFIHKPRIDIKVMNYKFLDACIHMSWQECRTRLVDAIN